MKTYNQLYLDIRQQFIDNGIENFSNEARLIISNISRKSQNELIRDMRLYTTSEITEACLNLANRRCNGEPLAYLLNYTEFYGVPLKISKDVLIPRIDTEVLVDAALDILEDVESPRILDLCTGSGCIACAIGHNKPSCSLVAIDISKRALDVCKTNIVKNRLANKTICLEADVLEKPPVGIGTFDMIVCNPPYIETSEIAKLDNSVKNYEPHIALDGGKDGLKFYKKIIKNYKPLINMGGHIIFEVGEGQSSSVSDMLFEAGFTAVNTRKDTIDVDRIVIGSLFI